MQLVLFLDFDGVLHPMPCMEHELLRQMPLVASCEECVPKQPARELRSCRQGSKVPRPLDLVLSRVFRGW